MLETYGLYILAVGLAVAAIGFVWLLVVAFKERLIWGLALLVFPPVALVFACMHFRKSRAPLLLFLLAGAIIATPYGLRYYERHFVKLGPHEEVVDGELRITLTGLNHFDYSSLQGKREAVVLQMANEDVDDRTLEYLKGLDQLRTLDVSGSRVTDEGFASLATLPRLQKLYLGRTKITDEGFRKYVATIDSLRKVDLTGTAVKGKTKRDWKKAKPEERDYVKGLQERVGAHLMDNYRKLITELLKQAQAKNENA